MPQCSSKYGAKARRIGMSEAKREANRMTKKYGIWFKPYRCGNCGSYHIGRKYQTVEYSQFMLAERVNEPLVGKLVQALRAVLDKE